MLQVGVLVHVSTRGFCEEIHGGGAQPVHDHNGVGRSISVLVLIPGGRSAPSLWESPD
jgi:hypothetical protein